jgi:hypothetical protein
MIGAVLGPADAISRQESLVGEAFAGQHIGHGQHHGGVGVGANRDPLSHAHGIEEGRNVVADWADDDEADAGIRGLLQPVGTFMPGEAAGIELGVLHRQAAETDHLPGLGNDGLIGTDRPIGGLGGAADMGQQRQGGGEAVIVFLGGEAANGVHEAAELALGMVEPAGGRPAIGAGEDGVVAVLCFYALELARDQIQRLIPRDRDEAVGAPVTVAVFEPAFAHHGLGDPRRPMHHAGDGRQHRRGVGVVGDRQGVDDAAIPDNRVKRTPVRGVRDDLER